MAAEYSIITSQTVAPNAPALFPITTVPCRMGLVFHREGSGLFRLASPSVIQNGITYRRCTCVGFPESYYVVSFHGNIQVPTGGTVGTISLGIALDGEVESVMSVTPAAVEEPFNVGTEIVVSVPWICRCSSLSLRNISANEIEILNGVLTINYSGIR